MGEAFLPTVALYLAAALVAVPLFRWLGLGSVLGYLVAGLVIGPGALGLIQEPKAVLQFAEFGIVMLLFTVGLELNPARLWSMRRLILGLGGIQVVVTAVLAATLLHATPLLTGGDMSWGTAWVLGMAVSMSSTPIALQVLAERGLMQAAPGESAFAVALFQDLAIVPMLILLKLMAAAGEGSGAVATVASLGTDPVLLAAAGHGHGGDSAPGWGSLVQAIVVIVAMVVGGRYLLRPVLRWVAQTGLREVFVALALLLVIGSAMLTEAVGLSMAMGAFIAGLLLADSEYRMELEVDIEPFKGLLLGLFFMAVGMSIDVPRVLAEPGLVVGLAAVMLLVKLVILGVLARVRGLRLQQAVPFALAISQVGEFAFVLLSSAERLGLIEPTRSARVNAAVVLTMLSTPLLYVLWERVLLPRWLARHQGDAPPADTIDEQHPVIIAGLGRFGQVVSRVLHGRGYATTIIDHDPNHIEVIRQFGWRAYYGDASRPDVLASAGAGSARLLVLALDDPDATLRIVQHVRQTWPGLRMIVRVRNRQEAFTLLDEGQVPIRETQGSALEAARQALQALGASAYAARQTVHRFALHDEALMRVQAGEREDRAQVLATSVQARSLLSTILATEGQEAAVPDAAWAQRLDTPPGPGDDSGAAPARTPPAGDGAS